MTVSIQSILISYGILMEMLFLYAKIASSIEVDAVTKEICLSVMIHCGDWMNLVHDSGLCCWSYSQSKLNLL